MIHELRTPFTLIVAPIDHMLSQKDLSPVIQQDLALVKRNTKHTLKIINQVLDLQKIQNESKLTVQRIEIAPFIEHIINNFQSIAIQRESEITFESKESPLFLWADPDEIGKHSLPT
ncbi:MAG: sensor histidine kinase [Bacteroides cellulosilyticus]